MWYIIKKKKKTPVIRIFANICDVLEEYSKTKKNNPVSERETSTATNTVEGAKCLTCYQNVLALHMS